jgi:ATP-dependent DNA helicase RecG
MTVAELEKLLLVRSESEHIEFKEAKRRYSFEELVGYCVALANEGGGQMVLGVTDAVPRQVVGTEAFAVPEWTVSGIFERIHLKIGWEEVIHPKGRVLVFEVPSRSQGHPVHVGGRYFMRAGSSLVPMSPDQLKRIFDEARVEFVRQAAVSGCSEEDVMRLLDVQGYFDLRKRPSPSTRKETMETLTQKGFLRGEENGYAITNLGALLLAKRLDDFAGLSRKAVRVVVYEGVSKTGVKDGKDAVHPRGYASGFEALIDIIHDESASEDMSTPLRRTTHAYPKKAIRELVGNALVHQDLAERGTGVTVEIFSDRIEVTNPGLPILPVDRFIDENQSRNETFAEALRQLGICEERGHGMDAVVEEIERAHLPPYQYRLATHHTTVILARYKPLRSLTPEQRAHAVYQHCCLRFVNNQVTNNESVRERFKIEKKNAAMASRLLSDAVTAKKIRPVDAKAANKLMSYVPYWA